MHSLTLPLTHAHCRVTVVTRSRNCHHISPRSASRVYMKESSIGKNSTRRRSGAQTHRLIAARASGV